MTRIRVHGAEIVDQLGPLYAQLHNHYAEVVPELCGSPQRDGDRTWAARRARYLRWFQSEGTFVVASEDLAGYAIVIIADGYDGWEVDRIGEVKDLVVAQAARRRGIGSALLDVVEQRLRSAGVGQLRLNVLEGNEVAAEFYARRGLIRTARTLSTRIGEAEGR
jgi:GNAT superfamily N-acetyltransferase